MRNKHLGGRLHQHVVKWALWKMSAQNSDYMEKSGFRMLQLSARCHSTAFPTTRLLS
jgi:hypothetical protein